MELRNCFDWLSRLGQDPQQFVGSYGEAFMYRSEPIECKARLLSWRLFLAWQIWTICQFQVQVARGDELWRWLARKPKVPHEAPCPPNMVTLAKKVTLLEDQVRRNGSITIKQPDVWSENSLLSYIQEYDQQLTGTVGNFRETIQAFVATTDSSQFASSTAVGRGVEVTVFQEAQKTAANAANQEQAASSRAPLSNLSSFLSNARPTAVLPDKTLGPTPFALEPNELERQHSVYVQMNQALRRTNMGDDNSRAAGNALYLMRFPVSVLPGRETYEGYSAVITLQAHLAIDANHLRYTFPRLVAADAVDGVLPIIKLYWHHKEIPPPIPSVSESTPKSVPEFRPESSNQRGTINVWTPQGISNLILLYGPEELTALLNDVKTQFAEPPKDEELKAYLFNRFLNLYEQLIARGAFTPDGQLSGVLIALSQAGDALARGDSQLTEIRKNWNPQIEPQFSTDGLDKSWEYSWILGLHAAILDLNINRLIEAQRGAVNEMVVGEVRDPDLRFFVVNGPRQAELNATWAELIESEFPIHVFALNPVIEEQNVYDAFSRSRDLQVAFALAVANGNMRASQAMRYSRQVTLEMASIGLNRTAVAFAHSNDTFGWYFHPRVQSPPPERNNIAALGRQLWSSGPTRNYDEKHQRLEPGIRECEAVIVMPAFVPSVRFDVITNWEKRNKPGAVKRDYAEMIVEGAEIQKVLDYATQVQDQTHFRPNDFSVLVARVEQIENMLPLQAFDVRLPFDRQLSGQELFDGGKSQLRPVVDGFYGLQYVDGSQFAEVFLTGSNFHPVLTRVILGGREADEINVMSRELLKVRFKPVYESLADNPIEGRVATPAGISAPFTIKLKPAGGEPSGFAWTATPLDAGFVYEGTTPVISQIRPPTTSIMYAGGVGSALAGQVQIWLSTKYLRPDGTEIETKHEQPRQLMPIERDFIFGDGQLLVTNAELLEFLKADLNTALMTCKDALPSFTVKAETYLVLADNQVPVKLSSPLIINLKNMACDLPHCQPTCPADSPAESGAPAQAGQSSTELMPPTAPVGEMPAGARTAKTSAPGR